MKLFSMNIFVRPKPIKTGTRDYRRIRLNILAPRVKEYDVVCLQEFFVSKGNRTMIQGFDADMEANGFKFRITGPETECCRPVEGGLAIFAKTEPIESGESSFSIKGHSSDWFACKGYEWALFPELLVINTHLEAEYGKTPEKERCDVELAELGELWEFSRGIKAENVLIVGDLNIDGIRGRFVSSGEGFNEQERVEYAFDLIKNEHMSKGHAQMPSLGKNGSVGYDKLTTLMQGFRDLCFEYYQSHPVTFRDCNVIDDVVVEQDRYLNPRNDYCSCRRLDYSFFKGDMNCSGRVNVMRIQEKEHEFLTKLSDHSAMEIVFNEGFPEEKNDNNASTSEIADQEVQEDELVVATPNT